MISRKIVSTVIAIGSLFYSSIPGVVAEFDDLTLETHGDELVLSTRLVNCFSDDLDTILRSGEEIRIIFQVEVLDTDDQVAVHKTTLYHAVIYSLIDRSYGVFRSNTQEHRTGLSLEQAKTMLSNLEEVGVVVASELAFGVDYAVRVTAHLGKVALPGTEEELNLMYYWSSIRPTATSEPFSRDSFRK
ncbi:MAG: DUF4390 domain-containing protein [Fidelibacterota bacterium]